VRKDSPKPKKEAPPMKESPKKSPVKMHQPSIDDQPVGMHRNNFTIPEQPPKAIEQRLSELSAKMGLPSNKSTPKRISRV
jgi:hypothetical protein